MPRVQASWNKPGSGLALAFLCAVAVSGCKEAEQPPPTFQVFYLTDKFFDVASLGGDEFIALGYRSKVIRSSDAGQTWTMLHEPERNSMTRFHFFDAENAAAVGHQGRTFATTDGGKTWTPGTSGAEYSLFDLSFPDEKNGFAVGDKATIARTSDGGKTWTAGTVPIFEEGKEMPAGVRPDMTLALEDPIYYAVEFLDANVGWIVGEYGQIRHTQDGGASWSYQHGSLLNTPIRYTHQKDTPPVRDMMTLPTFFDVEFRDAENGVIVGTYGAILTTNDGGNTWAFNPSPAKEPLYEVSLLPDGDALISGSSGVMIRGNAENGFTSVELPAGIYTWLGSLAFNSKGQGLATGGYGMILSSEDFGRTWAQTLYQ